MRRTAVLATLVALAAAFPARADDAARLALAKKLMVQIRQGDTIRASIPLIGAQLRRALAAQGRKDEEVADFVARYQVRLGAEVDRYSDMMAEAYAVVFTEEDLEAVIAFDETPAGRRFIAQRPELNQASYLAMQKLDQDVEREIAEEMEGEKDAGRSPHKM